MLSLCRLCLSNKEAVVGEIHTRASLELVGAAYVGGTKVLVPTRVLWNQEF